jgi:hypothetical protein
MPEAALSLFELESPLPGGFEGPDPGDDAEVRVAAEWFCRGLPHRQAPYGARNWGGLLHSLCSYQGKLKPAIAHFLVALFSRPGDVLLDPMAGVGTVPLEARRQGRVAIGGDMSELAAAVTQAKLERFDPGHVQTVLDGLDAYLRTANVSLARLIETEHAGFGLNGAVAEYFDPRTLREILLARRWFRPRVAALAAEEAVVLTALLHLLHGNRPYALSRRSHPVTPLKPTGPFQYRPVMAHLRRRVEQTIGPLREMSRTGTSSLASYTELPLSDGCVDVVVTSPPFAQSLRFFSSNWMRLWFCGWGPDRFARPSDAFLERRQRVQFDDAYREFLGAMHRVLRPGGLLVMHLGETARVDMTARVAPLLAPGFAPLYAGRECVADTESHGLSDKGATRAHGFLFARAV